MVEQLRASQAVVNLVVGLAGTGKTCTVIDWITSGSLPCAWLKVDQVDVDPGYFFANLNTAIEVSGISPQWVPPVVDALSLSDVAAFAKAHAHAIASALAPNSVLVIDEVHCIDHTPFFLAFLQNFAQHRDVRLVLISRGQVSPELTRLIVAGELDVLDCNLWPMTVPETTQMLQNLGVANAKEQGLLVHQITHGWPAAIAVAAWALKQYQHLDARTVAAIERLIDGFVSDEILPLFSAPQLQALTTICWLPCVVTNCKALPTDLDLREYVQELVLNVALMHDLGEHRYTFHPLVQSALKQWCLRHLREDQLRQRVDRCVRMLQVHEDWDAAADLALEHQMFDQAAFCLRHLGEDALKAGQHRSLAQRLRALPDSHLDGHLLLLLGQALASFDEEVACEYMGRALKSFAEAKDGFGQSLVLRTVGPMVAFDSNRLNAFVEWGPPLAKGRGDMRAVEGLDPPLDIYLRVLDAFSCTKPHKTWRRESRKTLEQLSKRLQWSEPEFDLSVLASTAFRGLIYGDLSAIVQTRALASMCSLSSLHSQNFAKLIGEIDHIACVHIVRDGEDPVEEKWGSITPLTHAHTVLRLWRYAQEGALSSEHLGSKSTDALTDARTNPWFKIVFCAFRLKRLHEGGERTAARQMAQTIDMLCQLHPDCNAVILAVQARSVLIPSLPPIERREAICHLRRLASTADAPGLAMTADIQDAAHLLGCGSDADENRSDHVDILLRRILRRVLRHGASSLAWQDRLTLSNVLSYALSRSLEPSLVVKLIQKLRLKAPNSAPSSWPWIVRLQCIGSFKAWVDGELYQAERKSSHRQLELLKGLAATVGEPQAAQSVASRMWPAVSGSVALKNLQTTVARLRTLLGHPIVDLEHGVVKLNSTLCYSDVQTLFETMDQLDGLIISKFTQEHQLDVTARQLLRLTRRPMLEGEASGWLQDIATASSRRSSRLILSAAKSLVLLNSCDAAVALVEQLLEQHPLAPGASELLTTLRSGAFGSRWASSGFSLQKTA